MIARRKPLKRTAIKRGRKRSSYSKRKRDTEYMLWIKSMRCSVRNCQCRDIEAAHVGLTGKGMSRKCIDTETIPLCGFLHHREGPQSVHKLGRKFWEVHELDRQSLIEQLNHAWRKLRGL